MKFRITLLTAATRTAFSFAAHAAQYAQRNARPRQLVS